MKRKKLHEIDLTKDIRYKGPLSYRSFRILGWLCIALSQVALLMGVGMAVNPTGAERFLNLRILFQAVSSLSLPFLVFANFAVILDNKNGYKNQLLVNGLASAGFIVLFSLFYYRYIVDFVSLIQGSRHAAIQFLEGKIYATENGFLAFNIFIDLFLCSLFLFFLDYEPNRVFVGKKRIWFRLMVLFPIFYELGSMALKTLSTLKTIKIPVFLFPFLTVKPPVIFVVFIFLAVFIKNRERRFCKYGRTKEEYTAFLKTNRNSLQFSIFVAVTLVVSVLIALTILVIVSLSASNQGDIDTPGSFLSIFFTYDAGKAIILLPFAPLMLLFSYTRTYKKKLIDFLIPVGGIILIIFVYLEAVHFAAGLLPEIFD